MVHTRSESRRERQIDGANVNSRRSSRLVSEAFDGAQRRLEFNISRYLDPVHEVCIRNINQLRSEHHFLFHLVGTEVTDIDPTPEEVLQHPVGRFKVLGLVLKDDSGTVYANYGPRYPTRYLCLIVKTIDISSDSSVLSLGSGFDYIPIRLVVGVLGNHLKGCDRPYAVTSFPVDFPGELKTQIVRKQNESDLQRTVILNGKQIRKTLPLVYLNINDAMALLEGAVAVRINLLPEKINKIRQCFMKALNMCTDPDLEDIVKSQWFVIKMFLGVLLNPVINKRRLLSHKKTYDKVINAVLHTGNVSEITIDDIFLRKQRFESELDSSVQETLKLSRVEDLVKKGQLSKATEVLLQNTASVKHDFNTFNQLEDSFYRANHSERDSANGFDLNNDIDWSQLERDQENIEAESRNSLRLKMNFDKGDVLESIRKLQRGKSCGVDKIPNEFIKSLYMGKKGDQELRAKLVEGLHKFLLSYGHNELGCNISSMVDVVSLRAIPKNDVEIRPILINSYIGRVFWKVAMSNPDLAEFNKNHFGYDQLALQKGGIDTLAHSFKFAYDMHTEWDFFSADARRAYNQMVRDILLKEVRTHAPSLYPAFKAKYGKEMIACYFGLVTGVQCLYQEEGGSAGSTEMTFGYCLAIHPLVKELLQVMGKEGITKFFADDSNFAAPFDTMVEIIELLNLRGPSYGYELNKMKGSYLISREVDRPEAERRKDKLMELGLGESIIHLPPNVAIDYVERENFSKTYGMKIVGTFIGTDDYVHKMVKEKLKDLEKHAAVLENYNNLHAVYLLTRYSFSQRINFYLRNLPPRFMRPIVDDFIKMYRRIAGSLIGKPIVGEELETIFQQLLFRLSEGGIGIRSPDIAAKTAYTASVVDSMYGLSKTFPSILDYADENEVETFHGFIEDLAVYNEDEQELLRIKRVEALSKSDLIQAVFDQVKHINDNAVMTLIEPSETYENHEISEFGRINKMLMRLLEISRKPLQHEDRSERFVDSNTKNGKTSMQDKLYTILSKGEHTHFMERIRTKALNEQLPKGPWWKLYARLKGLNRDSGLWLNHYPFASDQFLSPLQWKTALNHRYYLNLEVIPNGIKCTCRSGCFMDLKGDHFFKCNVSNGLGQNHDQIKYWLCSFLASLQLQVRVETRVGNKRVDIYTAQRDSDGISGRMRVIDIRVTHDVANLGRSDMEDPDQPLNKAFEEKTNLHADNALANDVDNMPAIVSCVGRIHPSLLKFMYEQLTFHAKKGSSDSFVESKVQSKMTYWKQKLSWLLTRRISITTIFRSDLLLRNFHVNDQHIQIFDGSMDADSDSCVLNNFFDVRKE